MTRTSQHRMSVTAHDIIAQDVCHRTSAQDVSAQDVTARNVTVWDASLSREIRGEIEPDLFRLWDLGS